jgi:multiple stress resistance protein BhsA
MKNMTKAVVLIVISAASLSAFAANQVQNKPAGQQRIGVISASAAGSNLSELVNRLDAKATDAGAGSYRVVSAGGRNYLYGTAEIYK